MSETLQVTLPLAELPAGCVRQVRIGGEPVAVANVDGEVYAVHDVCTHAAVPLSGGPLAGRQIVCPWHGAMFDLKTGRATCGPAVDGLRCYDTRIEEQTIIITPPERGAGNGETAEPAP